MPSHKVHRAVSRLLLGSSHPDVDRIMDLFGDDPEKLNASLLHILVDLAAKDPKVKKSWRALLNG